MKTFKHLFTTLLLLCAAVATAHDFEAGGIYYNITDATNKTVAVTYKGTSYSEYSNEYTGSVAIPKSVTYNATTYSVTSIEETAFRGCSGLTSIEIPNSVTSIGSSAFYRCSGLTNVVIGNSVTIIGYGAFEGCSELTSITIPNSITSIGERAFYNCYGLTSVVIGNSVTSIGEYAFDDCTGLYEVHISDLAAWCSIDFESYDANPLCYAKNLYLNGELVTELVIPEGVKEIKNYAFYYCTGLTSITIPNSVTSIEYAAFYGCSSLANVSIGTGVQTIENYTFNGCTSLKNLRIEDGEGVLTLGYNTHNSNSYNKGKGLFYDCPLDTLYLGRDLSYGTSSNYGYSPFYDKSTLTSVIIGDNVTGIGSYAFFYCDGLTSVVIGNSVTTIEDYAFGYCTGLASIEIPNSVTSIGESAFSGCKRLTSVTIGNSVTSIGNQAFYNCTGLKKAIWLTNTPPSGYTNVNAACNYVANNQYSGLSNVRVYSYLSSMFEVDGVRYVPVSPAERTCDAIDCTYNDTTSVDIIIGKTVSFKGISMNVKEIMPYTLYANKKIKSVKVENEGNIGDYAFDGCTALETANISNNGNIGNYAFKGSFKTASSTVTISNKGSIGSYAFGGCNYLVEATLGDSVTSVGTEAFSGCSRLKGIEIPDDVTAVGSEAFYGCSSLKSAKIGAGVAAINEATFSGCSAMTLIAIGENIATIGKNAFYGCSSLEEITIPQAVTEIGNYAFDNCSSLADVIIEDNSTALSLGSNGSSPLFADCPLDSMYIGRKINYSTSSSYGYSPFYRNASLRTVVITDTETEIYDNEFYGCSNLKNVSIGNGVKKIGKWAFSGCSSLDYFAFGENVESIGSEAFSDCNNVTRILTNAMTPPVCGAQALDDINKWNCSLFVPNEAKSAYLLAEQWKEFFFIEDLPSGINDVVDDENYNGTPGVYYDLSGRAIENPASGIYIIDGKKIILK